MLQTFSMPSDSLRRLRAADQAKIIDRTARPVLCSAPGRGCCTFRSRPARSGSPVPGPMLTWREFGASGRDVRDRSRIASAVFEPKRKE
jgi:hypothetical protein